MSQLIRWAGALALVLLPPVAITTPTLASAQTAPSCTDASGQYKPCVAITVRYDQATIPLSTPTGLVAGPQTLAAAACTTQAAVTISATYGLVYVISGTSPSLTLQSLGPDGVTWMPGPVVTATGSQVVPIFAGSGGLKLRWCNTGSNPVIITSSLSS